MSEVILKRKDGTESTITWAEFNALDLNRTAHQSTNPLPTRIEATDAEQAAAEARAAASAVAAQKAAAIAALRSDYLYNGVPVATSRADIAFYETLKNARGRNQLQYPTVVLGTDGSALVIADAAELDAFHTAVETEANSRAAAVIAALGV